MMARASRHGSIHRSWTHESDDIYMGAIRNASNKASGKEDRSGTKIVKGYSLMRVDLGPL